MMPNFETGPLKTDGFLPKERKNKMVTVVDTVDLKLREVELDMRTTGTGQSGPVCYL